MSINKIQLKIDRLFIYVKIFSHFNNKNLPGTCLYLKNWLCLDLESN